jgi:hypothetical protein
MPKRTDVFVQGAEPTFTYVARSFTDPRTRKVKDPEKQIKEYLNP